MPCCGQCEMPHVRFLDIKRARSLSGNEKICGEALRGGGHQSPSRVLCGGSFVSIFSCPRREIHPLENANVSDAARAKLFRPLIYSIWFDDRDD